MKGGVIKAMLLMLLANSYDVSFAQKKESIPKIYRFFSEEEEWILRVFDFKTFELLAKKPQQDYYLMVEGRCVISDTTIQFICDSSVNLNVLMTSTDWGINIKGFIQGDIFKRENDYIIPKASTCFIKNNIFGKYYQQYELNMGGIEIDIKKRNKYTLTNYTCKGNFIQKGNYIQSGNCITFKVNKKATNFSSFHMDNNLLFVNESFAISRKIQASTQPERFPKEEVFLYFLKM